MNLLHTGSVPLQIYLFTDVSNIHLNMNSKSAGNPFYFSLIFPTDCLSSINFLNGIGTRDFNANPLITKSFLELCFHLGCNYIHVSKINCRAKNIIYMIIFYQNSTFFLKTTTVINQLPAIFSNSETIAF